MRVAYTGWPDGGYGRVYDGVSFGGRAWAIEEGGSYEGGGGCCGLEGAY